MEIQARVNESSEWRMKVISSAITTLPVYIGETECNLCSRFAELI